MPTTAARKIREYLATQDMTQGKFAEILGTTDANLSRIVNGLQGVSLDLALRIKDATRGYIMPEDFRQGEGEGDPPAAVSQ